MRTLFCFGLGFTAKEIAGRWSHTTNGQVFGTHRDPRDGAFVFSDTIDLDDKALAVLQQAEAILISIPPDANGDPVFRRYGELIASLPNLKWLGYFSTTGVYGDCDCAWVDETATPNPQNARSKARLLAETQWLGTKAPVHIFRLSGIYGPGRNALQRAREGSPLIEKPNHVMNRIHVSDISRAVVASINEPTPYEIYNLSDDEPADSADVLLFAYELLGLTPPRAMHFEKADLSPTAKEFYAECKRVSNDKIESRLGITWKYPSYREGLLQCLDKEDSVL